MFRALVAVVGILCVAVAAALIGWREYALRRAVRVPVDVPFPAEPSRLPAQTFAVERPGNYVIAVKIARPPQGPERIRAECLLGFDPGNAYWGQSAAGPPCRESPVVELSWLLTSNAAPVRDVTGEPFDDRRVSGIASAGRFAAYEVDRLIATFVAERGRRYTLAVETHANAAALQPFSPRLLVLPSSSMVRDEYVITTIVGVIGGWFGIVGLGLIGFAAWLSRRARRGAESSG